MILVLVLVTEIALLAGHGTSKTFEFSEILGQQIELLFWNRGYPWPYIILEKVWIPP